MRRRLDTHLKPRWGTDAPNPRQPEGLEYILKLRNKDSKNEPDSAFVLSASFIPDIADVRICEQHAPNVQLSQVTLQPQQTKMLSIFAIPKLGAKGTAQLIVIAKRDGEDPVTESGHNAKIIIEGE